jgi:hypothetical protein
VRERYDLFAKCGRHEAWGGVIDWIEVTRGEEI